MGIDGETEGYFADGERRAMELGNRGPVRFVGGGALHPDIVEAYWEHGFYIFEGVFGEQELADIEADLVQFRRRFPTHRGSDVDQDGNRRSVPGSGRRTSSGRSRCPIRSAAAGRRTVATR